MHKVAVKWFRATNKYQYARICLDYAYLLVNLNPVLSALVSSSVELYNRYRFAYEATIVGILAYLLEVLPDDALNDPASLMEAARVKNQGIMAKQTYVRQ